MWMMQSYFVFWSQLAGERLVASSWRSIAKQQKILRD
jgi:hypothetical protein